jgi:cell division septation protein DedD
MRFTGQAGKPTSVPDRWRGLNIIGRFGIVTRTAGPDDRGDRVSAPIFISYSSKDQDIAETICQALEARGHACWIAARDVHPGENFQEAIVRALRAARVMLLVFTSNANNSDEIKKELVLAGRHHVTVVPVRVEDVVPNDAFSYEFATRQWVDLFKDWEREIELLATNLRHVMQTERPGDGAVAETAAAARPSPRLVRRSSHTPLILGSALAAVIVIGGIAFYMRPFTRTSPIPQPAAPATAQTPQAAVPPAAPVQAATPTPPPAPSPPPQVATVTPPAPPPEPPPVSTKNPDETAWESATGAGTRAALDSYLKEFSAGVHVQEAELRLADLILTAPATTNNFDGTWQTTWTCFNYGNFPGYTFLFPVQVKNGTYHGQKGKDGEPGSLIVDGKVEPNGTAAFFGKGVVGSAIVALGAARGTQYAFHALAQFDRRSGTGKRIEGRPCTLSFVKE